MRRLHLGALLLAFITLPSLVSAHHSRAEFGDEIIELEGVLTDFIWRNPHIALFLDVEAADGTIEYWRIEAFGGVWAFDQSGVSSDQFQIGERLRIAGRASTRRDAYLLGTNAQLSTGTEVILGVVFPPRWDGPVIGGATQFSGMNPEAVNAAAENHGFFRIWSIPGRGVGLTQNFSLTEAAIAERASWDPTDNPITRCEPPGMPITMLQPGPFQLSNPGDGTLTLHSPWFDTVRTIHLNPALRAEDQPPSPLGFSQGRMERNVIVVETTRINYPYLFQDGTRQSTAIKVTERFELSDDQSRLDYRMTVTDPATFTEPGVREWHYLALSEPFFVVECNVF